MTPKTLSLNSRQWRVLLHDNLEVLKAAVAGTETINDDGLKQLCTQLDDMKMLARAWFQVSVPPASADVPVQANGAEPIIKKRRGRPPKATQEQVIQ